MSPIIILAPSRGRAWAALNAIGFSELDRRLSVVWRAAQIDDCAMDAVAACVGDAPQTLPADLQSAAARRSLRLIRFADLPTAVVGMRR